MLVEAAAVSNVPAGVTYTVSLFLDGETVQTIDATMDCTDRDEDEMDEELDIAIGFGSDPDSVTIADTQC
ncbi:hypothetical protein [Salinilacihabitans rarus]|uniref:hypothetical protein n=1 Tax=Salinilacihabitans rarus TaxID=2961596 RepID=UPI0020C83A43|nr:hypothetical protein [Salinilacihabitans rarus]